MSESSVRPIYVPIADTFFESSIMQENLTVRFVMLALIRLALRPGANGIVDVDLRTFAASIVLPVKDVEDAIKRLMEPDPASGCEEEEGRRIVPVNQARPFRGWRLVNFGRYRDIVRRANDAARKREERAHPENHNTDTSDAPDASGRSWTKLDASENGGNGDTIREDMRRDDKKQKEGARRFAPPSLEEIMLHAKGLGYESFDGETFRAFYESKGWVVGKSPMRSWKAAVVTWHNHEGDFDRGRAPSSKDASKNTNPLGLRLSKDGATVSYKGEWYHVHSDGKRWLTAEDYRPDGTSIMSDPRDKNLNDRIYAAMAALVPQKSTP